MGFWNTVLEFAGDILDRSLISQVYPTLQDAVNKYRADDYDLIECEPLFATLKKQGVFGAKTVTLRVQEDGSVHVLESGVFGEERVIPKTTGAPTPQEFIQMLQEREAEAQTRQALSENEKEAIVFRTIRTIFLMFGKIAKADSQVSKDEISAIEEFMTEIEFNRDTRKVAIEFFNEGKETRTPFREIAAEFAQYVEDVEKRRDTLYCLVLIATADGALHEREERYLDEAVAAFGLSPNVLTEALKEILPDMQQYYAILGCDPSASDDELKRCYRELSLQYHPDRISPKDLPPHLLKLAEEKFKEIQNAYQIITQHRK